MEDNEEETVFRITPKGILAFTLLKLMPEMSYEQAADIAEEQCFELYKRCLNTAPAEMRDGLPALIYDEDWHWSMIKPE